MSKQTKPQYPKPNKGSVYTYAYSYAVYNTQTSAVSMQYKSKGDGEEPDFAILSKIEAFNTRTKKCHTFWTLDVRFYWEGDESISHLSKYGYAEGRIKTPKTYSQFDLEPEVIKCGHGRKLHMFLSSEVQKAHEMSNLYESIVDKDDCLKFMRSNGVSNHFINSFGMFNTYFWDVLKTATPDREYDHNGHPL